MAIPSVKWSIALSLIVPFGISTALRIWNWPALALVLPGAFAIFMLAISRQTWRWITAISVLLTAWWLGVTSYAFYDHFIPEPAVRGGLSVFLLVGAIFLMVLSATAVIRRAWASLAFATEFPIEE